MAEMLLVNPRRRKRRKTSKKPTTRRKSYTRRISTRSARKTRRRRNPIRRSAGFMGIINQTVMPAATAAVGALGLDVIWGYAPIPDTLKVGPMRYVAKAAGAVGLGMLAAMLVKKSTADQMATGALTVVLHQAMKDGMTRFAPNIAMGEYLSGYESLGYYGSGINPESLGEYMLSDQSQGSGYFGLGATEYDSLTL